MIEKVPMYRAVCDKCKCGYGEDLETYAYDNADFALDVAIESGWHIMDDGRLLCPDCYEEELKKEVK